MTRTIGTKIQTQHRLLSSQLSGLLRAVEEGHEADATDRVERLARSLELHLTLEEEHYFPQKRAAQPQLADGIDELLLEHADIRSSLRQVAERLSAGDASGASEALNRYAEIFRSHEKREHDLLDHDLLDHPPPA